MVLTFIIKSMLFQQKQILKLDHFMDVLFVLGQIGLLGVTIYGYLNKKEFAKYSGIAASLLIILTMDFFDIVIGILYFLFCIDQNYYVKMIEFVKKTIESFTNKKSS